MPLKEKRKKQTNKNKKELLPRARQKTRNATLCEWGLRLLEKDSGRTQHVWAPGLSRTLTHQAAPSKSATHGSNGGLHRNYCGPNQGCPRIPCSKNPEILLDTGVKP